LRSRRKGDETRYLMTYDGINKRIATFEQIHAQLPGKNFYFVRALNACYG
jgi:hypothetical protein